MKKLSPTVKVVLLVVAVAIALGAGWFALIAPKRSQAARLQEQIDETRAQLTVARHGGTADQAPTIRVADLFELSRAMPNRTDMANVLLQLSDVATETGVSFQSITPHDPVPIGAYQQVGIDLVFEGHFYDLSDFLYRLRNLVGVHEGVLDATGRLFSVDSISFDEGDLQFPQVKATLTVSAYVFGNGTAAPVPPAATSSVDTTTTTTTGNEDTQPVPAAPSGATAAGA
jgi:Pilus assembly protein, PilO